MDDDLRKRLARLSPAKRRLLERKLGRTLSAAPVPRVDIPPRDRTAPTPLSSAQQRFWLLDHLAGETGAYRNPFLIHLRGPLRADRLRDALGHLFARHEILRTTFTFEEVSGRQTVLDDTSPDIRLHHDPALTFHPPDDHTRATLAHLARGPLSPAAPLTRFVLLQGQPDDQALLVLTHHLVFDGWSKEVFVRDLAMTYAALAGGQRVELPDLPFQFGDYAVWEQQRRQGPTDRPALDYWRERLRGCPFLDLPTDFPRPDNETFAGARVPVRLDPELTGRWRDLCRTGGLSLFMGLLGAWVVLLHRWSGQNDFAVGFPIAGRTSPSLEGLIGCLMNTQSYRTDLAQDPSCRELLSAIRDDILRMNPYQDVPFARIVEDLQPPRDLSRPPVFQVMLNFRNYPASVQAADDLELRLLPVDFGIARFDLTLDLAPESDGLQGDLEYNTDLFRPDTARRIARHFQQVTREMAADPDRPVSRVRLMTTAEQHGALHRGGLNRSPEPVRPLLEQIGGQADGVGELTAVVGPATTLTYAELGAAVHRATCRLVDRGAGSGRRVGLLLERSVEQVIAVLALLNAGASFVPLPPEDPPWRRRMIVADAGLDLIIANSRTGDLDLDVPCLGWADVMDPAGAPAVGTRTPTPPCGEEEEAYLIYTSGSTGRPKGVSVSRRSLANLLGWMTEYFAVTPQDRLLHQTSFSFDIALAEMLTPLCAGATLVLAKPGGQRDPAYLADLIRHHGVTVLQGVPSWYRLLAEQGGIFDCPSVDRLISVGEVLPADLAARYTRAGMAVYNVYGPTETCIYVTAWRHPAGFTGHSIPIGHPIRNCRVYLLDRHRQPVPIGVAGELYIAGVPVARGYHNLPELTRERFLVDPFIPGGQERMYRSGDRGRFLADGAIDFLGRTDRQMKRRGYRIEPAEIESALLGHPDIGQAVVSCGPGEPDQGHLAAWVVPVGGRSLDAAAVQRHVAQQLPEHMIPTHIQQLSALPYLPSGKVDLAALPPPTGQDPPADDDTPFQTPLEQTLAEIWRDVLPTERIHRDLHFFHAGGHSLLATRLVARLEKRLRLRIPLRIVFDKPRLRDMAAWIDVEARDRNRQLAALVDEIIDAADQDIGSG